MKPLRSLLRNKLIPPKRDIATTPKGKTTHDCPYCGYRLPEPPVRKKKCPQCGQFIYVRKPFLMTEREAQLTDWKRRLEGLGLSAAQIDAYRADLMKQFGFDPPVNDVIWRALNTLVATKPRGDEARMAYGEMAQIARSEGKDPKPYLVQTAKLQLLEIKRTGLIHAVEVQTCNDRFVCPKCRALAGRTIPLGEALADLPVPNECESESGCRCSYVAAMD